MEKRLFEEKNNLELHIDTKVAALNDKINKLEDDT